MSLKCSDSRTDRNLANLSRSIPATLTLLSFVRSVVPRPGMAVIPLRGIPARSEALTRTNTAKIKSSPPESPTTIGRARVCGATA